jgi:hypothetical protein
MNKVNVSHYSQYANNAEPVGWALRQSGHGVVAAIVQAISVTSARLGKCLSFKWLNHEGNKPSRPNE